MELDVAVKQRTAAQQRLDEATAAGHGQGDPIYEDAEKAFRDADATYDKSLGQVQKVYGADKGLFANAMQQVSKLMHKGKSPQGGAPMGTPPFVGQGSSAVAPPPTAVGQPSAPTGYLPPNAQGMTHGQPKGLNAAPSQGGAPPPSAATSQPPPTGYTPPPSTPGVNAGYAQSVGETGIQNYQTNIAPVRAKQQYQQRAQQVVEQAYTEFSADRDVHKGLAKVLSVPPFAFPDKQAYIDNAMNFLVYASSTPGVSEADQAYIQSRIQQLSNAQRGEAGREPAPKQFAPKYPTGSELAAFNAAGVPVQPYDQVTPQQWQDIQAVVEEDRKMRKRAADDLDKVRKAQITKYGQTAASKNPWFVGAKQIAAKEASIDSNPMNRIPRMRRQAEADLEQYASVLIANQKVPLDASGRPVDANPGESLASYVLRMNEKWSPAAKAPAGEIPAPTTGATEKPSSAVDDTAGQF